MGVLSRNLFVSLEDWAWCWDEYSAIQNYSTSNGCAVFESKPLPVKTPWVGFLWKIYLLRKQAGWECYSKEIMLDLVYVMPWKRLG
jgi:hypothetical protein